MSSEPSEKNGEDVLLRTDGLSKCYHVYKRPQDRLRQFFARGDRKLYSEFWALRDVDLTVCRGETLGIVGRNGAGKSTLLQLIAGTLKPTEGSVTLHGRVTALLELGSGFHNDFTGRENIYVAGALLGLDRDAMDERMARIESFADIGEFIDRPVKTYSKGMFARLSFSVYANLDPEVFIVDEALAVGDARFRHKCMYRFKQMQEQGIAVLYVSHDATSMKHLCDRVAWIHDGRLECVGEPTPVVDRYLNHLFDHKPPVAPARRAGGSSVRGDDELGSQEAVFDLCEMRDEGGERTEHVVGERRYELVMRLRNGSLATDGDPLLIGFSLATVQGLAITGTNNRIHDVAIPVPPAGESTTVRYRFDLPPVVPGSYAISLTAMTVDDAGETHLVHFVQNALTVQASYATKVLGLIGLPVEIEVEG